MEKPTLYRFDIYNGYAFHPKEGTKRMCKIYNVLGFHKNHKGKIDREKIEVESNGNKMTFPYPLSFSKLSSFTVIKYYSNNF